MHSITVILLDERGGTTFHSVPFKLRPMNVNSPFRWLPTSALEGFVEAGEFLEKLSSSGTRGSIIICLQGIIEC